MVNSFSLGNSPRRLKMQIGKRRILSGLGVRMLALIGCLCACIYCSSLIANAADTSLSKSKYAPPTAYLCYPEQDPITIGVNTGCSTGGSCPWYTPNRGNFWYRAYLCQYDPTTKVNTGLCNSPSCTFYYSGCCNDLDYSTHCDSGAPVCPPTYPGP